MSVLQLVQRLADGAWHRVDDAASCLAKLAAVGLEAEFKNDDRCRLLHAIELLDRDAIESNLVHDNRTTIQVAGIVDSTNTQLLKQPVPRVGHTDVLLAEFQNDGRGRHGRTWLSPFGSGLCQSFAWQFDPQPREPGTLSLAVGVAVIRALNNIGVVGAKLKWPNDVHFQGQKLGGVLLDAQPLNGALHVVAGIGLNVRLPPAAENAICADDGIAPVDLFRIDPALAGRRNEIAAALIDSMVQMQREFRQKGFDPFREQWNDADVLAGCAVRISGSPTQDGEAIGIDESGALMVRIGKTTRRFISGDVRVRAA